MHRSILLPVLLVAALATPAAAEDVFPLTEGLLRTYQSAGPDSTRTYSTYFAGTALVGGAETRVLHFAGGADDGLEQDWSESPSGDKYLHGWYRADCLCGIEYAPAILCIDMPLVLDKTWDVTTEAVGWGTVILHFRVTAVRQVTVPAGTFESFTIEWYAEEPPPMKAAGLGLTGKRPPQSATTTATAETYADAAGLVRSVRGSTVDSLQGFEALGVQPVTWTRVREFYR